MLVRCSCTSTPTSRATPTTPRRWPCSPPPASGGAPAAPGALPLPPGRPVAETAATPPPADPDGARAGYVESFLRLAGRTDIPVETGAACSLRGTPMGDLPAHDA